MTTHRVIHHVAVDDATVATLLEAAETAKMTLLDFEAWILADWARLYEQHRRKIKEQEATREISQRG